MVAVHHVSAVGVVTLLTEVSLLSSSLAPMCQLMTMGASPSVSPFSEAA